MYNVICVAFSKNLKNKQFFYKVKNMKLCVVSEVLWRVLSLVPGPQISSHFKILILSLLELCVVQIFRLGEN